MNKDVQDNVRTNIFNLLADYSKDALVDLGSISESQLSDIVSDSLSVLEIIYELEDKFKVTISADNLQNLRTVSDLAHALDNAIEIYQQ